MSVFTGKNVTCLRGERMVFADLDFALDAGGAVLLVGPNGSGKSSLLRLMAGFLRPYAGALTWDGTAIGEDAEAHGGRTHYVGHLDAVKPALTVFENIAFWAHLRGHDADGVAEALDALNITHLADVPGRFLSAGQKRRVSLARLVAAPAPLWLLDEPTTALDAASITALEGLIAGHRAGGGLVVASTHADIALEGAVTLDLSDFQAGMTSMMGDVA